MPRMDEVTRRILSFATGKDMELACAALKVLGELGTKDPAAQKPLAKLLASPNRIVARYALSALRETAGSGILAPVAAMLSEEPALAEEAAAFCRRHPVEAVPFLEKALGGDPKGAARALALLAEAKDLDPARLLGALRTDDETVVDQAVQVLRARLADLPAAKREAFLGKLRRFSEQKAVRQSPAALTACVKILGADGGGNVADLLGYAAGEHPPRVQRNAFFALAKRDLAKPDASRAAKAGLAALAAEPPVAEAAIELLRRLAPERSWMPALKAALEREGTGPARPFALEALARLGGKEALSMLLARLSSEDREERHAAARALSRLSDAPATLLPLVDGKLGNDAAWSIAEALRMARDRFTAADKRLLRKRIVELAKREDPAVEVLLPVAREAAGEEVGAELLAAARAEKAPERRRSLLKQALKVLPESGAAKAALAAAEILESPKEMSPESRRRDRALGTLAGLAKADPKGTAKLLSAEKGLGAKDLYYVGFHFAERPEAEGDFGREVLKLLLKRHPRHELAEAARNKLKLKS